MLEQYTLCIHHYVYYQSLCLMCIPMCYFLMINQTHITSAIINAHILFMFFTCQ